LASTEAGSQSVQSQRRRGLGPTYDAGCHRPPADHEVGVRLGQGSRRQFVGSPDRGEALLDGRRGLLTAELLDVGGDNVTLLLNIQRQRADPTASDHLVRRFADHFWKVDWPGSARPKVFYDPRALDPEGPGGVLHAKAVVADDEAVFITSANLTEAAFERNIELGILIATARSRSPSAATSEVWLTAIYSSHCR